MPSETGLLPCDRQLCSWKSEPMSLVACSLELRLITIFNRVGNTRSCVSDSSLFRAVLSNRLAGQTCDSVSFGHQRC